MNLIEQLGGYEKVKQMWVDGGSLQGTQLAFELLEHRRENNIFEVGDFVIYGDYELFKIIGIQGRFNLAVQGVKGIPTISVLKKYCRHATPQEIAQGYRYE